MNFLSSETIGRLRDAGDGLASEGILDLARRIDGISGSQDDFRGRMMDALRYDDGPGGDVDRWNEQVTILRNHFED